MHHTHSVSAHTRVLDKGFRLKLISKYKKREKQEVILQYFRENFLPCWQSFNLHITPWMGFLLCGKVQKLLKLIQSSEKFAGQNNNKKDSLHTIYRIKSRCTSKSKKIKLISEVWHLDICMVVHKHTHTHLEDYKHSGKEIYQIWTTVM